MIAHSYIRENLKRLHTKYQNSESAKDKLFYSKLAILELCGWIEESMDDIVQKCANRLLRSSRHRNEVTRDFIKPNNGFQFNNFRKMLISLIGYINVLKLEKSLDGLKKDQLMSALDSLKNLRNSQAHTHLKGITRHVDAPESIFPYFDRVYYGLKDIEDKLKVLFP